VSVAVPAPRTPAWLGACRPATLPAAAVPVLAGSAVAWRAGGFRPGAALAALAGALFIQIGTNLANDVFDFWKGADRADRLGPVRAVAAGLLGPREVLAGMALAFALATACGAYLASLAGWPVIAIGVLSIASGVLYTAGPFPLAYVGLGDLFVMLFFGFVAVCGTVFVETGSVPAAAIAVSIPIGALSTAILVVNNLRDREQDARAGKRTLAVRFGRRFAVAEYALLLAAAYATPLALARESPWVMLTWLSLPIAFRRFGAVRRSEGRALNAELGGTAKLLLLFGALLSAGLLVP
jgi:1,4-dihydroxy-2-naphthoate octaprenyltransferase